MTATARAHPGPINAINVTPFIDVLLVLMIMIVITIPTQTHKVPVNLPVDAPSRLPATPHQLGIGRDGGLLWDARQIADAQLPALLAALAADKDAELQMSTDPEAHYDRFDAVLAMVKRANITRLGFVGNQPLAD